ncbi:MAG TPA: alpha/beta hydrolase [Pseudonocardia sp.]|nr:alpha/beta hydrolase [Pseudonocardia sp.]
MSPENAGNVPAVRAALRAQADPALVEQFRLPVAEVRDKTVPGDGGDIPVRIYRPDVDAPHGTLVFFHGGGWAIGDLESHDIPCRHLCRGLGMTVLAVDYRLAPEHPFPAGIDDAVAATRWALANVAGLGGDADTLVIGGDSAGGNFAAVVAQELRSERIAAQVLIYPGTDASREYPSAELFAEGYFLDSASMTLFRDAYLVEPGMASNPRVSPLLAEDLTGLPPAVVVTAEFDPIRDQGDAYARALTAAGNTVLHRQFPALTHGFLNLGPFVPAAAAAIDETIGLVHQVVSVRAR